MVEVKTFEADHFLDIMPRMWDAEKEDLLAQEPEQIERVVTHLANHPAWTLYHDGLAVACFGVLVTERTGEAWVYFTPDVRRCKAEFEKAISDCLEDVIVCWKLDRVGCGVIKGYDHLMPWVERLGFSKIETTDEEVRFELCPSSQH